MAMWNPLPTKTSCLVIDGGATIIVPKGKCFNNYSEVIIKNGTLKFESFDSYADYKEKGVIRIGPTGKMIILDSKGLDDVTEIVSDCAVGATIDVFNSELSDFVAYTLIEKPDNILEWSCNNI